MANVGIMIALHGIVHSVAVLVQPDALGTRAPLRLVQPYRSILSANETHLPIMYETRLIVRLCYLKTAREVHYA